MSFLKSISGHTSCSYAVQRYLEYGAGEAGIQAYVDKESRAIGHDFLNIKPADQADWARAMDTTRTRFGNDREHRGLRAVTYRHFVVSPDPADKVDLDTLRDLALAWAEANFADYQVAITYHDDNKNHIPHAHIVVNNTNLNTGKRLHFTTREAKALADNLQTLAMERGLRHFANVEGEETHPENVNKLADWIRNRAGVSRTSPDRRPSAQREIISKSEREARARGAKLWKADIRDKVLVAMWLSDGTEPGFAAELEKLGVHADFREGNVLYTEIGAETHKVTSTRLGTDFGREGLIRIATVAALRIALTAEGREKIRAHAAKVIDVDVLNIAIDIAELETRRHAAEISLRQIDDALEVLSSYGIKSIYQGNRVARQWRGNVAGERIQRSVDIARAIGILPDMTAADSASAEKARQKREAEGKLPLAMKINKGYRLTKEELASLTPQQRITWEAARLPGNPASPQDSNKKKRNPQTRGSGAAPNRTRSENHTR